MSRPWSAFVSPSFHELFKSNWWNNQDIFKSLFGFYNWSTGPLIKGIASLLSLDDSIISVYYGNLLMLLQFLMLHNLSYTLKTNLKLSRNQTYYYFIFLIPCSFMNVAIFCSRLQTVAQCPGVDSGQLSVSVVRETSRREDASVGSSSWLWPNKPIRCDPATNKVEWIY